MQSVTNSERCLGCSEVCVRGIAKVVEGLQVQCGAVWMLKDAMQVGKGMGVGKLYIYKLHI